MNNLESVLYTGRLEDILAYAIEQNAGDINITEEDTLSFRIGKDIKEIPGTFINRDQAQQIVLKLTQNNAAYVDLYKPSEIDGSYKMHYKNKDWFFRYNISLASNKVHISIRKLIEAIPDFHKIQMDEPKMMEFLNDMNQVKEGLYLVVGATGSGKSTTIVTALDYIMKNNNVKVITLEAPIEFYFNKKNYPNTVILQREVGKDTNSFYQGLVAAMRQNPDIIFVGEIRDKQTAEAALNASLTGHMVVATLHAKSIEKTKERMQYLLDGITNDFDFINGIVYQKLVKDPELGVRAIRDVYIKKD